MEQNTQTRVRNLERESEKSALHLQWGLALFMQGRTREALWDFCECVGEHPEDLMGHYMCGLALAALGLTNEARDEWKTVLALQCELLDNVCNPTDVEPEWVKYISQRLLAL